MTKLQHIKEKHSKFNLTQRARIGFCLSQRIKPYRFGPKTLAYNRVNRISLMEYCGCQKNKANSIRNNYFFWKKG